MRIFNPNLENDINFGSNENSMNNEHNNDQNEPEEDYHEERGNNLSDIE